MADEVCNFDVKVDFTVTVIIPISSSHDERKNIGTSKHPMPYTDRVGNYNSHATAQDGRNGTTAKGSASTSGVPENLTYEQGKAVGDAISRQIDRWLAAPHNLPGVPKNVSGAPSYIVGTYRVKMTLPGMELRTDCGGNATSTSAGGTAESEPLHFEDDKGHGIPVVGLGGY